MVAERMALGRITAYFNGLLAVDARGGVDDGVHGRASVLLGRGEHFHVSMLHVPFGPWQRTRANSQRDV
jgi:hypothetical protein